MTRSMTDEDLRKTEEVLEEDDFCHDCKKSFPLNHKHCKKCNSPPDEHEIRDYQIGYGGPVYCLKCGEYVRDFDPT